MEMSSAPAINVATFKKVVKDVIKNEDRSKNLMVFGLAEEDGEQLDGKLSSVFMELGEKPRVEAVRIGRRPEAGTACRSVKVTLVKVTPVKVTLASSTAVQQIMSKARTLKHSGVTTAPALPGAPPNQGRQILNFFKKRSGSLTVSK